MSMNMLLCQKQVLDTLMKSSGFVLQEQRIIFHIPTAIETPPQTSTSNYGSEEAYCNNERCYGLQTN